MTNKGLILLDLFAGIGGFHKGLADAGFNFGKIYFSEIDTHAIANYKKNYPHAEHIGSVESICQSGIERPDIITFGSPCQDFSLAGNRKGLAGNKSPLISHALEAVSLFRPDILIWENVKGTFSSNAGRDFWSIIKAFADIGDYGYEWQLVNTSWVLPQNRERIYLIGHSSTAFRDWQRVFPIGQNETLVDKKDKPDRNRFKTNVCGAITTGCGGRPTDTYVTTSGINVARKLWNGQDGKVVNTDGVCLTIGAGHGNTPKIELPKAKVIQLNTSTESNGSQPYQHNRLYSTEGISPTLDTDPRSPIINHDAAYENSFLCEPQHFHKDKRVYMKTAPTVQASYGTGGDNIPYVNNIRRLTEIECERLQGFPDGWTEFGNYDGIIKKISKTQRYKMLGNAVTAKMVKLIGERLIANYRKANVMRVDLTKSNQSITLDTLIQNKAA